MTAPRRVVVTGIGAISPFGVGRDALWRGVQERQSMVRTISRFDPTPFRTHVAAEVRDFHPADHLDAKRVKRLDRFGHFAVAAARLAVEDAELDLATCDRRRVGAMLGSALGGVGYAEAPLFPLCFGSFALIRAMSTRNDDPQSASRPFDAERDGFVMGEGAAVLVLEERARAVSRGAPIIAELVGYGSTNDGYHMTAPHPDGREAARAMQLAMEDAHIAAHDVGYVNAHASSTPLNDPAETAAIHRALGDHALRVPVSGTKGFHGHALGATGAWEAAISAMAIGVGWVPPTLNLVTPDARCDLDYVPRRGRRVTAEFAISNSFGFGGINACLVFRRDHAPSTSLPTGSGSA